MPTYVHVPRNPHPRASLRHLARRLFVALSATWALGMVGWAASTPPTPGLQTPAEAPTDQEPIMPIPLAFAGDQAKVALGERLFHDVRLSRHRQRACATCHQLAQGGDDGMPRALTADGTLLLRNTPTIFNVALNFSYNWDGGVRTLEAHATRVLRSPELMNTTWPELLATLRAVPDYLVAFTALYPAGLTPASVLDALVTYERSLLTPNSRFDHYLQGQQQALTAAERHGYQLFKAYGCVACHQGMNVGGNMFQKFGLFQEVVPPPSPAVPIDLGRFLVTHVARDREVFRVPSLRNVAVTAPYFHDGRAPTLEAAVATMARVQLGRTLTPEEIAAIVQFLHTLTGEYRGRSLADPGPEAR